MSVSNNTSLDQLVAALAARGVIDPAVVVGSLTDEQVSRAPVVLAYFDEQDGVGPGLLLKLLRSDRPLPAPSAPRAERRRERFAAAVRRAKASGFTDRQAPFAAMAWLTATALSQPNDVESIRARVRQQYSWIFNNEEATDAGA